MSSEELNPVGTPNTSDDNMRPSEDRPVNESPKEALSSEVKVENIDANTASRPVTSKPISETINFDRVVGEASEQLSKAADAFSRGDFMQDEALDPSAANDDRLVAALCYFVPGLMSLLVIFSDSGTKRPFQRYHAVQSLGLSVALVAISIAYSVISAIAWAVPIIGWLVGAVLFCLAPIAFLMAVIAYLYYGYQAYLGKRFAIPGLTGYLRDQGWI